MLYDSNLCASVAGKPQVCANSVLVSLWWHHFDVKWNTEPQIQNGVIPLCVRRQFVQRAAPRSVATNIDWFLRAIPDTGVINIDPLDLTTRKIKSVRDLSNAPGFFKWEDKSWWLPIHNFAVVTPPHAECWTWCQELRLNCFLASDNMSLPSNSKMLVHESNLWISSERKLI